MDRRTNALQTDRQTNRPTRVGIEAPSRSLKNKDGLISKHRQAERQVPSLMFWIKPGSIIDIVGPKKGLLMLKSCVCILLLADNRGSSNDRQ